MLTAARAVPTLTCGGLQEVYDRGFREIVAQASEGLNGAIFAYGQTSSGKAGPVGFRKKIQEILILGSRTLWGFSFC